MVKKNPKEVEKTKTQDKTLETSVEENSSVTPKKEVSPKSQPKTMDELLSLTGYKLSGIRRGQIMEGVITSISSKEVLIDIGAKTEGMVTGKELDMVYDYIRELKVGDKVITYVVSPENDSGEIILSLRRASGEYKWKAIEDKKETGEAIEVTGLEVNRGGLIVDVEGTRGFIPASQLDISHLGKAQDLINKKLSAKIIEVDRKLNRLILSEKVVLNQEAKKKREEALKNIEVGKSYKGTVSGVAQFGIFVNVEGLEGLVHISELSWDKVISPASLYKAGDAVEVKVLSVDEKEGKLNLSIKQLTKDPWIDYIKGLEQGQEVKGTVSRITTFGVFITLKPGLDGLIHVSKMLPEENLEIGQNVTCILDAIDVGQRRISLSLLPTKSVGIYK